MATALKLITGYTPLALQNVSLPYNIPKTHLKRIKIQSKRFDVLSRKVTFSTFY
jgi:hypothetical protein